LTASACIDRKSRVAGSCPQGRSAAANPDIGADGDDQRAAVGVFALDVELAASVIGAGAVASGRRCGRNEAARRGLASATIALPRFTSPLAISVAVPPGGFGGHRVIRIDVAPERIDPLKLCLCLGIALQPEQHLSAPKVVLRIEGMKEGIAGDCCGRSGFVEQCHSFMPLADCHLHGSELSNEIGSIPFQL
jgi:hypothetical protein